MDEAIAAAPAERRVVTTPDEADALLAEIEALTTELGAMLETEAQEVAAGRMGLALAAAPRKTEVASRYLRALETAKANAVALARLSPGGLVGARAAQGRLREIALANQAVLATARAVSESLVRTLSEEVLRVSRPTTYGAAGRTMPPPPRVAAPLVLSRRC